jgi:hypothetical protein
VDEESERAASGRTLDDVLADLNRTAARLQDASDVHEKIDLRDRLNRLRSEAAELRGSSVKRLSDGQLRNEIRSLRSSLDDIRSQRFDPSMVAGASGYGGGLDPVLTARHNQRVDAAGGRLQLEARLRQLLEEQARRS